MKSYKNIDEYIRDSKKEMQIPLRKLQMLIEKCAPSAVGMIRYGMPAYKLNGKPFVYFALCNMHIGFYPTPSGVTNFRKELKGYTYSNGAIQFPINKPLPTALIKKIVAFRAKECAGVFDGVGGPASRALANAKIKTVKDLARWRVKNLLTLHGIGPSTIPKLRRILATQGLTFALE